MPCLGGVQDIECNEDDTMYDICGAQKLNLQSQMN